MEEVYHYTKIRNGNINILESIVRNDALHFHSSFFANMHNKTING